jgi:type VI secretion system protein ImpL
MKKILGIIFHPVLLAVLGLIALAAVIWFFGPLLAFAEFRPLEREWARLALIGLIVAIYVGKKLWGLYKAKRANAQMVDGLLRAAPAAAPGEPSASAQEVETLRQRFEEALAKLKQAKLGEAARKGGIGALFARRHYLYQLPWYIFIGAPGSGKTTALVNSGLQFPLAESFGPSAIRGIGGTRNCDWWFTDEAVLLDTAGRYTTQESNREVDATAWSGFLQLLKKNRPRRSINGIILTISTADLLQQTPGEREKHAAALRARIQELHEQLNIRFPIYVLVTKCDLLAGFMDFFGEYGKEERAQVWGMTLPFRDARAAGDPLAEFATEFAALEARLNDRLVDRMQQERDVQKRALIYAFPQQFGAIKDLLGGFLSSVFTGTRFQETPMLRGVYFTSGTQEGSPIDRIMGALARNFGMERKILPPQAASGRSYFLTRLLKEVVFAEQGLAGTNLKWERRRALLQWGGYAASTLVTLGILAAWTVSYRNNQAYVAEVEAKLAQVKKQVKALPTGATTDVLSLLPVLQSVTALSAASATGGVPLSMGFGLFQGDKLSSAANAAYRRLLQDTFLQRLVYRLEEQLRASGRDNPELQYEGLKAYLMFHDPQHFDADAIKVWVTADWERNLSRDVSLEDRKALDGHLDTLFARGPVTPPLPADAQLIEQLRQRLAALPLPQRVYSRLKRQGVGADIPEFRISQVAGPAAPLVIERASGAPLTQGVPGLFTYDGYHKAFVKEAEKVTRQLAEEESWVMGITDRQQSRFTDPQALRRMSDEVRRLYLDDYARVWEKFVGDIRLVRPTSLQKSIEIARVLSASDSPMPALVKAMSRETTLGEKPEEAKTVVDKATDKVKESQKELLKMFGGPETAGAPTAQGPKLESIVDDRFDGLRRMARSPAQGQPAPVDASIALINELYTLLTATETAVKSGAAPPQSDVPTKIKAEAARMPEPLRSMLQTLSTSGSAQALGATRSNISASLSASLGDYCPKAINGRYPFVRTSAQEVTQEDFSRLFSPGGVIDEFFQKNLAQYVDTSTKPWSFKKVGDASMGDSGTLVQFQRAAAIRDVFFRGGGKGASLRLDFKPLEMDASINQFILDVDGQLVKYSHGPQVPQSVQWPGPKGSTQVRVQIQPPSSAGASGMVFDGPWALFRMFDRLQMENTGLPERFKVVFNIEGRKATFEVTASSVQNPFRFKELEQFHCPGRL